MILDQALVAAEEDDCYQALKLVRRIIQHEDAVLGKTADVTQPNRETGVAMPTTIPSHPGL